MNWTFFLSISFITLSLSADPTVYIVGKVGNNAITNIQVEHFIETTMLSDVERAAMFSKAGNYELYLTAKTNWLSNHFQRGLRQLLSIKLLEYDALKDPYTVKEPQSFSFLKGLGTWVGEFLGFNRWKKEYVDIELPPRMFFTLDQKQYDRQLAYIVMTEIGKCWSEGASTDQIAACFVPTLKKRGYPTPESATDLEVFTGWKTLLADRELEAYRISEAKQYAIYSSRNGFTDYWVSPNEIQQYLGEARSKYTADLQGKSKPEAELNEYFKENGKYAAAISDLLFLGVKRTPIFQVQSYDKIYSDQLLRKMAQELSPRLGDSFIETVIRTEGLAVELANSAGSVEELKDSGKALYEQWKNNETLSGLLKIQIYSMAIQIKSQTTDRTRLLPAVGIELKKHLGELQRLIQDSSFFFEERNKKFVVEDVLTNTLLRASIKALKKTTLNSGDKIYFKSVVELAAVLVKYEARKFAEENPERIFLVFRDLKIHSDYREIEIFFKKNYLIQKVKAFQNFVLRPKYKFGSISVVVDGKTLADDEAFDYMFGRFSPDDQSGIEWVDSPQVQINKGVGR